MFYRSGWLRCVGFEFMFWAFGRLFVSGSRFVFESVFMLERIGSGSGVLDSGVLMVLTCFQEFWCSRF